MTLRKKTILILGLTLAGLVIVLYLIATQILLGGFSEVEKAQTTSDVERARDAIDNEVTGLDRVTRDWGSWDDTYAYIQDRNPTFVASNLETDNSWINNRLNLMMFIDAQGQTVFAQGFDLRSEVVTPVPDGMAQLLQENGGQLLRHDDLSQGEKGLVMLPQGPMLISSQPILTSDQQGPSRGSLIWGRYLDDEELSHLSQIVHLPMTVALAGASNMPADFASAQAALSGDGATYTAPMGDDTIAGYSFMDDVFGNPLLTLRIETPRDVYNQGQSTLAYIIFAILAVGITFWLIIVLLLERTVISRMARISARVVDIGATKDVSARIEINGSDEVAGLAAGINGMLTSLEHSRQELALAKNELDQRIEQRTAQLQAMQALADIYREIASTTQSQEVLSLACRRVTELLGSPKSLIVVLGEHHQPYVGSSFGIEASPWQETLEQDFQTGAFIDHIASKRKKKNGSPQRGTPNRMALLPGFFAQEQIKAYALAPLTAEGENLGLLMVMDTVERTWTDDHLQILALISGQVALALEQTRLFEQQLDRRAELSSLYGLSRLLADSAPEAELMMNIITNQTVETINTTYAQIALLDGTDLKIAAFSPIRQIEHARQIGRQSPLKALPVCSQIISHSEPHVVDCESAELTGHERDYLLADIAKTLCLVPLQTSDRILGLLIMGEARERQRETFTPEKLRLATSIADQTVSALRRAELFTELESAYLQTVTALANAVDAKDTYTADHGRKLGTLAVAVGRRMGLTARDLEDLRLSALLHDIGKIGVPDDILQKTQPLNEEEWEKIRMHPAIGEQILAPIPRLAQAAKIVRHHHERFDGSGYPDGIAGDQIPLGARILNVVDSFSAIVDMRIYNRSRSQEEARRELRECAGTQFDPVIVDVFLRVLEGGDLDDSIQGQPIRRVV